MSPYQTHSALQQSWGALHVVWGAFKAVKCQVALSVLHWSVKSHVSCQSELYISRCSMWQSEHVQ